jgi:hypothetical protein
MRKINNNGKKNSGDKTNTRRNGLRTAPYWSISEQLDDIEVVDAFGI